MLGSLTGDLYRLRDAGLSDPAWTLVVIGDGNVALRDFDATRYWKGERTIPMSMIPQR